MPEVVVYLLEGRALEQKCALVKDITQAVVKNAGTTAAGGRFRFQLCSGLINGIKCLYDRPIGCEIASTIRQLAGHLSVRLGRAGEKVR